MPFFRIEGDTIVETTHAEGTGFVLSEATRNDYMYPVAGWCWFASAADAEILRQGYPPNIFLTVDELTTTDPEGFCQGVEATLHIGYTVTAKVSLNLPLTDTFRMPIVAEGDWVKLLMAKFVNGSATLSWTPTESGIWTVSQERINKTLPDNAKMSIPQLRVFVLEA